MHVAVVLGETNYESSLMMNG